MGNEKNEKLLKDKNSRLAAQQLSAAFHTIREDYLKKVDKFYDDERAGIVGGPTREEIEEQLYVARREAVDDAMQLLYRFGEPEEEEPQAEPGGDPLAEKLKAIHEERDTRIVAFLRDHSRRRADRNLDELNDIITSAEDEVQRAKEEAEAEQKEQEELVPAMLIHPAITPGSEKAREELLPPGYDEPAPKPVQKEEKAAGRQEEDREDPEASSILPVPVFRTPEPEEEEEVAPPLMIRSGYTPRPREEENEDFFLLKDDAPVREEPKEEVPKPKNMIEQMEEEMDLLGVPRFITPKAPEEKAEAPEKKEEVARKEENARNEFSIFDPENLKNDEIPVPQPVPEAANAPREVDGFEVIGHEEAVHIIEDYVAEQKEPDAAADFVVVGDEEAAQIRQEMQPQPVQPAQPAPEELAAARKAEADAREKTESVRRAIGKQLDGYFGKFEGTGLSRQSYIFIDGRPVGAVIADYDEKYDRKLVAGDKIALIPEAILAAQLSGAKVTFARLNEEDGSFSPESIEELPLTDEYKAVTADRQLAEPFAGAAASDTFRAEDKRTPEQAAAEQEKTNVLLARLSLAESIGQVNNDSLRLKSDLFRDIKRRTDPQTGEPETNQQVTRRMEENIRSSFGRYAFTSHALLHLVAQGEDVEKIFDLEKGRDIRAEAGKAIYDTVDEKRVEDFIRMNLEAAEATCDLLDTELGKIDFNDGKALFSAKTMHLISLADMNHDILQERDHFKDTAYTVIAKKNGWDLQTPEGKKKAVEYYQALSDRVNALAMTSDILKGEKRAIRCALGQSETESFADFELPDIIKSQFTRSLINRAQKNGEPVSQALNSGKVMELATIENSIENNENDPATLAVYQQFGRVRTKAEMTAFANRVISGELRDAYRFSAVREGDAYKLKISESAPGRSDRSDHAEKDEAFYTSAFRTPDNSRFAGNGDDARKLDRAIHKAFSETLHLSVGINDQGRLFYADAQNHLVPLELGGGADVQARARLRELAVSNRLFAVPEHETAPVQLTFDRGRNGEWKAGAADMLDAPAAPVRYGFFSRIGSALRIGQSVNRRKEYEKEAARASLQPSIREIKARRAEAVSVEAVGRKREEAAKAKREETARRMKTLTGELNAGIQSLKDVYGSHPVFREEFEKSGRYTKEQFAALKVPDIKLSTEDLYYHKDQNGRAVFGDKDFICFSMMAASSPEISGQMRKGGEDSDYINPEIVSDAMSTMYLNDFMNEKDAENGRFIPRQNIGRYIENTVAPARDKAAEAIKDYQNGSNEKLAGLIANGLAFYSRTMVWDPDSVPFNAVKSYFDMVPRLLESDPALADAVDRKAEQLRDNARKGLENVRSEREKFNAANSSYMKSVEKELKLMNKAASDLAGDPARAEEYRRACENAHDFFYKDNPHYEEMREKKALFLGMEKYHEANAGFSVKAAIKRIETNKEVTGIIETAKTSLADLTAVAQGERKVIYGGQEPVARAIFRAELLKYCEKSNAEKGQQKGSEIYGASKEIAALYDRKQEPIRRTYDEKLAHEDDANALKHCSTGAYLGALFNGTAKMNTFSPITDILLDPGKGSLHLDKIYDILVPDNEKFADMDAKVLLERVKKFPEVIGKNLRKLAEEKQRQPMASMFRASEKEEVRLENAKKEAVQKGLG